MKMATHEHTIDALNELLQKNVDAHRGYKKAGEDVEHTSLEAYLRDKSAQRQRFTNQIKGEIVSLGGEPNPETTVKGSLHHAWMDLKSALASNTDKAVFEECVRGERACLEDYEEKLSEQDLLPSARSLLINQRNQVAEDLERAKTLEGLTSY
jgi:uncharacterized protein (TIGR02284 family)